MSHEEEARLMAAINLGRAENREDFKQIHQRIDDLFKNGCAMAPGHADTAKRLSDVEKQMWRWAGGLALAAFSFSIFGYALARAILK